MQLAHFPLVADSLKCGEAVLSLDLDRGRVQLQAAQGSNVLVNYGYYPGDSGEAHTVPLVPPFRITLRNTPVLQVERVQAYQGEQARPVAFTQIGDQLEFAAALAGRVVSVNYSGRTVRNQVTGTFLDSRLQPSSQPSDCKLLFVQEAYGRSSLRLSLVRTR
ncbi:MAG: hypothetical protein U0931_23185 [Vulcanimicrobiota bacterium]